MVTSVGRDGSFSASESTSDVSSKPSPSLPLTFFPKFPVEDAFFCTLESESLPESSNGFPHSLTGFSTREYVVPFSVNLPWSTRWLCFVCNGGSLLSVPKCALLEGRGLTRGPTKLRTLLLFSAGLQCRSTIKFHGKMKEYQIFRKRKKKMEIYRILHRKTIYLTMFRWLKWNLRRCMSAFYKQLEILPKIKRITSPTLHEVPIHTQKGIKRRKYQTWESTLRKSQTSIDPEIVGSCKSFWRTETHENVIWRLGA